MNAQAAVFGDPVAFVSGDPLTALLVRRWKVKPWLITLAYGLVLNVPIIVAAFLTHGWLDKGNVIGLLKDYTWWILQVSSVPTTVFVFFWMPQGVIDVLQGLRRNKAIILSNDDYAGFVTEFDRYYSHWAWAVVSACFAIAFTGLALVPVHETYTNWVAQTTFVFWYIEFSWVTLAFCACLMVVRCAIVLFWFNRLFQVFPVSVKVLHPDGAGGLYPLGSFSVKAAYVIGIYGVAIVAVATSQSYLMTGTFSGLQMGFPLLFIILAYFVLAPVVFFAPLGAARSAMRTEKREFILKVSDQFEVDFSELESLLDANPDELKKRFEKIEYLQKIHKMGSQFPVWPFNTESLVRFLSSILSPVALALLTVLISLMS